MKLLKSILLKKSNLQGGLYSKQSHLEKQLWGDSLMEVRQLQWYKCRCSGLPTAATAGRHCSHPSTAQVTQVLSFSALCQPL